MAALTLGALGIVFGDIGTSPLYALQTVFSADHQAVKPTESDVFGSSRSSSSSSSCAPTTTARVGSWR
jgi:K+ transporter